MQGTNWRRRAGLLSAVLVVLVGCGDSSVALDAGNFAKIEAAATVGLDENYVIIAGRARA